MSLNPNPNFDDQLRTQISTNLSVFKVRKLERSGRKHAAVAVTVINQQFSADLGDLPFHPSESGCAAIILTIRASGLRKHAGQRAFPGGRVDWGETTEYAALRELEEEVGLSIDPENILGRLDDYSTRSGFVISPVVVWASNNARLVANPNEVETIHRIPVGEFLRTDAPILEPVTHSKHPVLKMPIGNDWIAAPTAAIAYQFREVALLGKNTRVAQFEQPRFAWN